MNRVLFLTFLCLYSFVSFAKELKVMQLNIWQETTMVENGLNGLVDDIISNNPDIVLLSEIRNYKGESFIEKLITRLQNKGGKYYGVSDLDVGVLSKYQISEKEVLPHGSGIKSLIHIEGKTVVAYSLHLDYTNYACYLPRQYSGVTWGKLDKPFTDSRGIEKANRKSRRPKEITEIINDASSLKNCYLIIGGDFNEPSHLDWQEDTKLLWEHRGAVVNWDCSVLLAKAGFKDCYREIYPNPKEYPGFTYPANNLDASLEKLDWVPDADGRDRIDFIYYKPAEGFVLKDISIIGPLGSICKNKRVLVEEGKDKIILPKTTWCTDHRGLLGCFQMR